MVLEDAWWEDLLLIWSPNTFTLMSYLETTDPGKKIVYTGRTSCWPSLGFQHTQVFSGQSHIWDISNDNRTLNFTGSATIWTSVGVPYKVVYTGRSTIVDPTDYHYNLPKAEGSLGSAYAPGEIVQLYDGAQWT